MDDPAVENKSPRKMSTGKKILFWAVGVLLLLIICVWVLICSLFSSPPGSSDYTPTQKDYMVYAGTCGKVYGTIFKKSKKSSSDTPITIYLSEDEVNSSLKMAAMGEGKFSKKRKVMLKDIAPVYKDGLFSGVIPIDTGCRFLNGGVIMLRFTASVKKVPGKLFVDIKSFKAGLIPLHIGKVNSEVQKHLIKLHKDSKFKLFDALVSDISAEQNGKLKIVCHLSAVQNVMMIR